MLSSPPHACTHLPLPKSLPRMCRAGLAAVALLLVVGWAPTALAAPDSSGDATYASDRITRFIQERGLVPGSSPTTPQAATPANAAQAPRFIDQVRDHASDLVLTAMNFLGVPYRRGGTSEDTGFDCSGFTRHVFENSLGLLLPRRAQDQANASNMLTVLKDDLKPGDLVFFNTMKRTFSHVGIYIGDGKFIHSPRTGTEVRVEDMRAAYWTQRFNGARRATSLGNTSSATSSATNPSVGGNLTSPPSP